MHMLLPLIYIMQISLPLSVSLMEESGWVSPDFQSRNLNTISEAFSLTYGNTKNPIIN